MSHALFWERQPALLFGLSLVVGTSSYLFWSAPFNWIWPFVWICYLAWLRLWPASVLLFGGILYSFLLYGTIPDGETTGYFSIASMQPHYSPFQKGVVYKGMLTLEQQRIPCSIYSLKSPYKKADCDYLVRGKLVQRAPYDFMFKAKEWIPVEKTWSFAHLRYQLKEKFRLFLASKLETAPFLGALITGDVEERTLRYQFNKLGLQHILAISGFHFAILIAFCSYFLSLILPYRATLIALLIAIHLYFLFVGSMPAVQRSWLTATLYLVAKLIGRHSTGLNLLGVALLVEVLINPLICAHLGFQLSFLSCAGILLFLPLIEPLVTQILPQRDVEELSLPSQHGYLITSFLRQSICIGLAVNLALLPLLLYHFHQFPLLSLLYNLFFPPLISISLFGLLVSLLTHVLFPPLAVPLFALTDRLTKQLLELAEYPPIALDYSIKLSHLPPWLIPLYFFFLFSLAIRRKQSPFVPPLPN